MFEPKIVETRLQLTVFPCFHARSPNKTRPIATQPTHSLFSNLLALFVQISSFSSLPGNFTDEKARNYAQLLIRIGFPAEGRGAGRAANANRGSAGLGAGEPSTGSSHGNPEQSTRRSQAPQPSAPSRSGVVSRAHAPSGAENSAGRRALLYSSGPHCLRDSVL